MAGYKELGQYNVILTSCLVEDARFNSWACQEKNTCKIRFTFTPKMWNERGFNSSPFFNIWQKTGHQKTRQKVLKNNPTVRALTPKLPKLVRTTFAVYVYLSFFWSEQKPLECYKWNVKALLLIIHYRNSLFSINDASVELKKNKNAFFDLKLQLKFLFLSFYFKIFLALKDNATRWEQIFLIKNQSLLRTQPLLSFKRNVLDSSVEIPYWCKCVMNPKKECNRLNSKSCFSNLHVWTIHMTD